MSLFAHIVLICLFVPDLIESELNYGQFTRILISQVHSRHWKKLRSARVEIVNELAHIYHFYLHGAYGLSPDAANTISNTHTSTNTNSNEPNTSLIATSFSQSSFRSTLPFSSPPVFRIEYSKFGVIQWSVPDLSEDWRHTSEIDIESQFMLKRRGTPFVFQGEIRNMNAGQVAKFQGMVNYYPYVDIEETHPEFAHLIKESERKKKLVEEGNIE
jgi:hypothetical protein